jgi:putative FmdB family regulatory protein
MPHYGYRCQSCQREFEMLQRMSDPPIASCPECGGAGTRLFYPAGILFKGSGFYKTDSRSSSGAAAAATPGDGAKPASDGAKPASDGAKPAAAPSSPSDTPATTAPKKSAPALSGGAAATAAPATD